MSEGVVELYPQAGKERKLAGLYLQQDLRHQDQGSIPFVYANFISSLDGRIAVPRSDGSLAVPDNSSNPRDWRLFQELAVQSDVMLSSGRYLREYEDGRAQEILKIYDDPALADLAEWRLDKGLTRYPAIAVISASLAFPIPSALVADERRVVVITTADAPAIRKRELEHSGLIIIEAGNSEVRGDEAIKGLSQLGFSYIYSAAGPRVLHLLLSSHALDRLYLTYAARILGGQPYSSIVEGPLLPAPVDFTLRRLYLDQHAPGPGGQLFASYDIA
jgi:riboflavin biosynthesis pyrimidine reductase